MKIKLLFLFWICSVLTTSATQYSISVVDSCLTWDYMDSSFSRTLYLFTDTGNFIVDESRDSQFDPWTVDYIRTLALNRTENTLDSQSRIIESVKYLRVIDTWKLSERRLYSFDASGNYTDSTYQVYQNAWINVTSWHYQYNSNNLLIQFEKKDWINNNWENTERTEWFRDVNDNDTLIYHFTGNGFQWDTTSLERKTYDINNNLLTNQLMKFVGTGWTNHQLFVYTYNTQNKIETEFLQNWTGIAWSDTLHSYYSYPSASQVHISIQRWVMSNWECYWYFDTTYFSPISFHVIQGVYAGICTDSLIKYDYLYDLSGRLVHSYENFYIASMYDITYDYDSIGFLYHTYSFSNTMSGCFPSNTHCYYFKPLIVDKVQTPASICQGDSMTITAGIYSGNPPYRFSWKLNSVSLPDTTPTIFISSANGGDIYSVTVTDSLNNNFQSDFTIITGANPDLGPDTTVCSNGIVNLMPGTFATYLWQDGSTDSLLLASSPGLTPDTLTYWVQVNLASGCSNTDTVTVIFDACLGTEEAELSVFRAFPNPVQDGYLQFNDENIESIEISDIFGRRMLFIQEPATHIYVGMLEPATYLLSVQRKSKKQVEKIIIQ